MNPYLAFTLAALEDSAIRAAEACPIARENIAAARTSADDVAEALDERTGPPGILSFHSAGRTRIAMKYLKRIRNFKDFYCAEFASGATTSCHDTACFFMVMADKGVAPADLESHIKIGEMVDPAHDWKEIRRVAGTFAKGAAA